MSGLTPLDEMFMAETMTAQVVEFADQSADRSFIGVYEAGQPILPMSDEFTYKEVGYSRGLAPVTGPGSPSTAHKPIGVNVRGGTVFAIKEHVDLPASLFMMAKGLNSEFPDPQGWLNANLLELTNRIQRTRNYIAAHSLLTTAGTVDLAAVPNSQIEGAQVLTFPVQALSAAVSWALAGTKIRSSEINRLKRTYKQNTGFKPGIALASDAVEGYITANAELSNPVDSTPTLAQRKIETSYLEGGSIVRLGGIDFEFVRDEYVTDANQETADAGDAAATVSDVISDADLMAVLPDRGRWNECFAHVQGRVFIPTGAITSAAVGNAMSLLREVRGWGSYLELITNPVGLRLHVVWHGSIVQKRRFCVQVFNTTP